MPEYYSSQKNQTSFREIVLAHLKRILEITTSEFRGGYYRTVIKSNHTEQEYVPDSRKCYIQSVESLSDVLLPYFDKEMKEVWGGEKDKDDGLGTRLETSRKGLLDAKIDDHERQLRTIARVELMRELFQQLNLLLKREDYLKTAIYSESDEDD